MSVSCPSWRQVGRLGRVSCVVCRVSCVCVRGAARATACEAAFAAMCRSPPVPDCFTAKFLQQGKDAFTVDGQIAQRVRIDDESDAATASSPESLPVRHDSTPFRTHHQRTAASLHPLEQRPVNLTFALC